MTFAEQLTAARKAAGMTQEELSEAVHVARNTISNWEHGRTQPDLDTIRALGQILHTDFLSSEAAPPAPSPVTGDAPAAPPRFPRKRLIALCAAALAVITAAVVLLVIHNARMSKTALITITPLENPVPMITDPDFEPDGLGWLFTFEVKNSSDVPFRPGKGMMLYYDGNAIKDRMELDYAFLRGCMDNDKLTNKDIAPMHINWGASYPLFTGVELVIQGRDDNGHELEARCTIALSQIKPQ